MLKKRVWKQLAVVGVVAMMASGAMSVRSFADTVEHDAEHPCNTNVEWDFDGRMFSSTGEEVIDSNYKFTKNEDGSWDLSVPDGDGIYLGITTNITQIGVALYAPEELNPSKEFKQMHVFAANLPKRLMVGNVHGGSTIDLIVKATCGQPKCPNFWKSFGKEITIHVTGTKPLNLLEEEYYDLTPFIREGGEQAFLNALNEDRARMDLKPLTYSKELQELAQRRVMEIQKDYVHTKVDGYGDYIEHFEVGSEGTRMDAEKSMRCVESMLHIGNTGMENDFHSETIKEVGVAQCVLGTYLQLSVIIIR